MNVLLNPTILSDTLLEKLENTEEGIIFAQKRIRELENILLFMDELLNKSLYLFMEQMKKKQKIIFIEAIKKLNEGFYSLNRLSEELSENLNLSFSTIKWNLTKMRDNGLFETNGQRGDTKTTLITTDLGETLYLAFAENELQEL